MNQRTTILAVLALAVAVTAWSLGMAAGLRLAGWPGGFDTLDYTQLGMGQFVGQYISPEAGMVVVGSGPVESGFVNAVTSKPGWENAVKTGVVAGGLATVLGVVAFMLGFAAVWPKDPHANSQAQGDQRESAKAIKEGKRVVLGGWAMPEKLESRHTLGVGSTGTGKSQMQRAAVKKARAANQPALALDIGAELTTRIYREGIDQIIGAYDARSVPWSPMAEMEGPWDAERVAAAMIPLVEGNNKVWSEYARIFCQAGLLACWEKHEQGVKVGNGDFIELMTVAPPAILREVLPQGHACQGFLDENNEKMFASIRGSAMAGLAGMVGLDKSAGFDGWSITKWATNAESTGSWLFVPVPPRTRDAAFPLASLVAGFVVDAVLGLRESETRRVWFLCDELGQYPAVSALARAQTLGRKYGLACVHSVQTVSQLRAAYGNDGADTLLSCYGNKMLFRCGDGNTAEWASKEIGEQQIVRSVTSRGTSTGGGSGGSSSTNTSEQYSIEKAVLASEIQALPDLNAYLLSPGLKGPRKVVQSYIQIGEQVYPEFKPRPHQAKKPEPAKTGEQVEETSGVETEYQKVPRHPEDMAQAVKDLTSAPAAESVPDEMDELERLAKGEL